MIIKVDNRENKLITILNAKLKELCQNSEIKNNESTLLLKKTSVPSGALLTTFLHICISRRRREFSLVS